MSPEGTNRGAARTHRGGEGTPRLYKDTLLVRLHEYLPPPEILVMTPDAIAIKRREEEYKPKRLGDNYAVVSYEGRLVIVPSWHPINTSSIITHGRDYATGSFEGLSAEPVVADAGDGTHTIVGANLVLPEVRVQRLTQRSLPGRNLTSPFSDEEYVQAMKDLVAILGTDIFVGPDGHIGRAYIRPSVSPGGGKMGVSLSPDHKLDVSIEAFHWPTYFTAEASERAYKGKGLVVAVGPNQRLAKIKGKHASNYGDAAAIGEQVKAVGADEALILAPHSIRPNGEKRLELLSEYENDPKGLKAAMLRLAIADGPGEEVLALTYTGDGKPKLLIPPMDVNRLGGTTADYVIRHLAHGLGIEWEERAFSLGDLKAGKIKGLMFAGNASRLAAIGEVRLHDAVKNIMETITMEVPPEFRMLIDAYERQVRGMEKPSNPSLLVPVDLIEGLEARFELDKIYAKWFQ